MAFKKTYLEPKLLRKIACIDIKGNKAIKSVRFDGLRQVGCPKELAQKYDSDGIEEIYLQDTTASLYGTEINYDLIHDIANLITVPLIVGGGIKSIDDCYKLLAVGADRVAINSALTSDLGLAERIRNIFGSQFLLGCIEYRLNEKNKPLLFYNYGREPLQSNIHDQSKKLIDSGVGELVLRCITNDGTFKGLNWQILDYLGNEITVPIILLGGANSNDFLSKDKRVSGIAMGSCLHYGRLNLGHIE